MKVFIVFLLTLMVFVSYSKPMIYVGDYGGRLISQTGKINRDLTLLEMKEKAETHPWLILGGDVIFIARTPKLDNKPLYLFDQMSGELQNMRVNAVANITDFLTGQINYQINSNLILDSFVTIGELSRSPFFITLGKQYIPYGDFNKFEAEVNPLNKTVFRIDKPAAIFSYYISDTTARIGFIDNQFYGNHAFSAALEKRFFLKKDPIRVSVGAVSNVVNMTKSLRTLSMRHSHVGAIDGFIINQHGPFAMRLEITQALKPLAFTGRLGAYNIDMSYKTRLLYWPFRLGFSTSGLYNEKNIKSDKAYDALGLFTHQYVASIKHRFNQHVFMGLSALIGKQRHYQKQVIADLIIKV